MVLSQLLLRSVWIYDKVQTLGLAGYAENGANS